MGLGGHLLWTAVVRNLDQAQHNVVVAHCPGPSDLLLGYLYDRSKTYKNTTVFRNNPRITFPDVVQKSRFSTQIDQLFFHAIDRIRMRKAYEYLVTCLVRIFATRKVIVHVDMSIHSYAKKSTPEKMVWKKGGHIIEILQKNFGIKSKEKNCELFFTPEELEWLENESDSLGLHEPYIVVEPNSNQEWFGNLRAWPFSSWKMLIEKIRSDYPDVQVVQVGVEGGELLPHCKSLLGQTSFREAALVIKGAKVFIGQEGGLMHTANAVDTRSLIIWGGVTLPSFAGYQEKHTVIHNPVPCAPCGYRYTCPNKHICLKGITVDQVYESFRSLYPSSTMSSQQNVVE